MQNNLEREGSVLTTGGVKTPNFDNLSLEEKKDYIENMCNDILKEIREIRASIERDIGDIKQMLN